MKKRIGVLALQGSFSEHIDALKKLDVECFEIRKKTDLTSTKLDGLIIPGGESTVIGKLLKEIDIFDDLKKMIDGGLPVFGTCAGLILLAKNLSNDQNTYFGAMDITAKRNAYGRQLGSFMTKSNFGNLGEIPMVFIRAPYIEKADNSVEVLAKVDENIVAARQGNILVTSFHPELTDDLSVYKYFLENCIL
jgi:5'-phosphate synthase pdxT subunit